MSHYLELDDFELEYLKIRLQLRKLMEEAYGGPFTFKGGHIYCLYYFFDLDKVDVMGTHLDEFLDTDIYFPTVESAEEAVLLIGEERLKKYYFCIEEKDGTNNEK